MSHARPHFVPAADLLGMREIMLAVDRGSYHTFATLRGFPGSLCTGKAGHAMEF